MSRRLLTVLLLGLAGPLAAQGDAMARESARLARAADSLAVEWREAKALADLADSLARTAEPLRVDTIVAGGLTVLVNPSPLPVRPATEAVWRQLDSLYGDAAMRIAGPPIRLVSVEPDSIPRTTHTYEGQEVRWDSSEEVLRLIILGLVQPPQPDRDFTTWLGGPVRPTGRADQDGAAAYTDLVTAPYLAARACFTGDHAACADALDLAPGELATTRFRSPEERREAVRKLESSINTRQALRALYNECVEGADSACIGVLRVLPPAGIPRALGPEARQVMMRLALEQGGRRAYARLLDADGAPAMARLEAASGLPGDALLVLWRKRVLASRPAPVTVTLATVTGSLGWALLLGVAALRSTRWRVT